MITWVEQGWIPAGGWNLPDEFEHPNKFAFTADKAQFILDTAGYGGYGQLPKGRRTPTTQVTVFTQEQFNALLNVMKFELAKIPGQTGHLETEVYQGERALNTTYYAVDPKGRPWKVAWTQESEPTDVLPTGFYADIYFSALPSLRRRLGPSGRKIMEGQRAQAKPRPQIARPRRRPRASAMRFRGYGQVHPLRWRRFRQMQGRSSVPYQGYGMTWDELANRLTIPE